MDPFKPKKSLGQHFLTDGNILRKIAGVISATGNDLVLEIGPGTGTLTGVLLERFSHLRVIEVDRRSVMYLQEKYPNLDISHCDILQAPWEDLLRHDSDIYVVGNLPYYITSQILFTLLKYRDRIKSAVLLMQKEVAERLVADPGNKTYGILSVQVQLMSTPELLFDVPARLFRPPPKVTGSLVRLDFDRPPLSCSDHNLKRVVRTAFQQRRKKISNALKVLGPLPEGPEFDYGVRPESWPPRIYEKLTARLEQLGTLP